MPIIPQYRAQGPAGPKAPVMEQQAGPRVDASEAVRGIARLTGALSGTTPVGKVDPNLGQRSAQGVQSIGQGVGDVGSALFDISKRVAEAKNYADEHEHQLAMDREVGEFEKWRMQNPDPTGWEPAWRERMERFGGQYMAGKNLAPVTQERIKQRLGQFTERRAIQVGVDAMRESVGRATSALNAEYMRAVESGDAGAAQAIADDGFRRGWIPEDQAERMKIQAQDQIETKQIEVLNNQVKTFLLYDDVAGALNAADQMPVSDDEKNLLRAEITQTHGYNITLNEVEDIIDPNERIKAIESGKYNNLRAYDKERFLNGSYQQINTGNADTVEALKDAWSGGVSLRDISISDAFKSLPESSQIAFTEFAVKGAKNDISEYLTALRTAQAYDPSKDTEGAELAALRQSAALSFDSERGQKIITTLGEAAQRGGSLSATERVMSDYFSNLQKRFDSGEIGNYLVTGDQISPRTDKNGVPVYTVPDPSGDFEEKGLLGTYRGRVVQLSEQDVLKYESGKKGESDFYVDGVARERAFSSFLNAQQNIEEEIERRTKAGEVVDPDVIQEIGNKFMKGELESSFDARMNDSAGRALPSNSFGRPAGALYKEGKAGAKTSAQFESEIDAKLKEWDAKANGN
jgi:hypothetical protein